jgi:hypothetical protein
MMTSSQLINRMIKDAQLWRDLLSVSGGELSATKCTYHFTHYNFTASGAPFLSDTPKLNPITINMNNSAVTIKKLSPYTPHKTLGCYKSPSGNNNYKALKQKSDVLGQAIWGSNCSPREVWTYYHAIYLPSISYSLQVSTLSRRQATAIQKKATHLILPMLGFNRYTPRPLVYGPIQYGGLGMRDLFAEQGIGQVQLFLKHWRTPGQAGQLLKIVMSWSQLAAGVGWPILLNTSTSLQYCGSQWILSLRSFLNATDSHIELDDTMIQPTQRENDKYIMDVILDSGIFSSKQIRYINYCRLYLNVITVSDISLANGIDMDMSMVKGNPSMLSSVSIFPGCNQARPGKRQWTLWKHACRLIGSKSGKLLVPLGDWTVPRSEMRRDWKFFYDDRADNLYFRTSGTTQKLRREAGWKSFNLHEWELSQLPPSASPVSVSIFDEVIQVTKISRSFSAPTPPPEPFDFNAYYETQLLVWEKKLFHDLKFLKDPEEVHNMIANGKFFSASDGGAVSNKGSYGMVVADASHEPWVTCSGPVFGFNPSSYRSEAFGLLATVRLIFRLLDFFGHTAEFGFTHYMDNMGVINRMNDMIPKLQANPNDVFLSEWDALAEIKSTLLLINSKINLQHVHSHQDDKTPLNSLSNDAKLNVLCDGLASNFLRDSAEVNRGSYLFPTTKCHLYNHGIVVTSKLKSKLRTSYSLPDLQTYMMSKKDWTPTIWNTVDWNAHSQALNKHYTRRKRIIQFIHNKLPTGSEMKKRLPTYDDLCHACLAAVETNNHLLECANCDYALWRVSLQRGLTTLCNSLQTDPVLVDLLASGIDSASNSRPFPLPDLSQVYLDLIQSQTKIGWTNLFRGHLSTSWTSLQHAHLLSIGETNQKLRANLWAGKIISFIWDKWFDLWLLRNTYHHGKTSAEKEVQKIAKTKSVLEYLYSFKNKVEYQNRDLFRDTLELHLEEPVSRQALWVKLFRQIILDSKNRLSASTKEDICHHFLPAV